MELSERLETAARAHGVPGVAVAVWHDGRLREAATGVLNTATGVETTTGSVFQIGSATKPWTAALVMQLAEEGRVDLDRPVADYLPEFAFPATVRQLLTHTGGFDGDVFEDTGRGDDCLDAYVAHLKGAGRVHEPGELFSYCNAGYCVLGALVARLRGTTWEQAMRERLIGPLGITQAALFAEEAVLLRASAGHIGPDADVFPRWQMPRSNGPAGSTFCLAPRELVRFGRMFLAGGEGVLSPESAEAMRTPQVEVPGVAGLLAGAWGLGFEIFEWGAYGHDGGTPGQSTFWRIVPGADLVIAMVGNGGAFLGLIEDVAYPVIREAGVDVPGFPVPPERPGRVDAAPYEGRYEGPALTLEVAAADGGLAVTTIPGETARGLGMQTSTSRYVHLSGDSFVTAEPEAGAHHTITFVMRDGRAAYLHNGRAVARA